MVVEMSSAVGSDGLQPVTFHTFINLRLLSESQCSIFILTSMPFAALPRHAIHLNPYFRSPHTYPQALNRWMVESRRWDAPLCCTHTTARQTAKHGAYTPYSVSFYSRFVCDIKYYLPPPPRIRPALCSFTEMNTMKFRTCCIHHS